jgi:hypothetical protein
MADCPKPKLKLFFPFPVLKLALYSSALLCSARSPPAYNSPVFSRGDAMKAKAAVVLIILLIILLFPARVTSQWPPLPQELAGGRPGSFHFSTAVQLEADRHDLAELRASIQRVHNLLPAVADPATRQALQAEVQTWQLHAARYEQRLFTSDGRTAATVEARLNGVKGRRQCAICHGSITDPGQ